MEQLWSSSVHWSSLTLLEAVFSLNQIQKVYLTFFLTWHTLKLNHEHEHEGISFIFHFLCIFHIWTLEQNVTTLSTLSTVT